MGGVLTTGLGVEGLPIVVEIPFIDERRIRTTGSRGCTMKRRGAAFVDRLVRPCPGSRRKIVHSHGRDTEPRSSVAVRDAQSHLVGACLEEGMRAVTAARLGVERLPIVVEVPCVAERFRW